MDQATTFIYVMRDMWNSSAWNEDDVPVEAHAIASWVRTHKGVNYENALDVLNVLYRDCSMRFTGEVGYKYGNGVHIVNGCVAHIEFGDNSRAMVDCPRGIGSCVELP